MATSEFKMKHLLTAFNMEQFYPEKLTINDLNEITSLSVAEKEIVTQETVCQHFINRLTRFNSEARNLKVETHNTPEPLGFIGRRRRQETIHSTEFHPLDIMIVVFLCCDPIAKQDFVKYLWECKLSVPFVIKLPDSSSMYMYKWPLRALVAQWQGQSDKTPVEYSVIDYPMQTVGVVRVGALEESKSALLNGLICGSERAHRMFFHRDSYGSKKQRSALVHGMIELGWYFPSGSETDTFAQCLTFANLRGDAEKCPEQLNLLAETSDLLIIMSHTRNLIPHGDMLRKAIVKSKSSLLIIIDKNIKQTEEDRIESLLRLIGKENQSLKFEILPLEDRQLAEKLEYICIFMKTFLDAPLKSTGHFFNCTLNISVDEKSEEAIYVGVGNANRIIKAIRKNKDKKGDLFPFQGKYWRAWTELEIEIHRLNKYYSENVEQDVNTYRHTLEQQKHDCRKRQFRLLDKLPEVMKQFLFSLKYLHGISLSVFLRALKLGLDELSRNLLRPIFEKYQEILFKKKDSDKQQNDRLNDQLEKLDTQKLLLSFGLENFTRELGQVFEACDNENNSKPIQLTSKTYINVDQLPNLAANILLNGYPVELMDGDVGFVPGRWVESVLTELKTQIMLSESTLTVPRLHVISVLGIQSSGKSTLLNTLFGLQFAVSAGRCTKGVFMQIVKVSNELRSKLMYDYILVIDTEGLRSAQLSSPSSIKFDNELSCFAIGLADTTVVNLMGENATYLEENLPIVVHAFLRMNMAGLLPHCMIVHHNVDKRNKQKLMEQGRILEKVLNDLTAKACDIERIIPHKRFKDIIEFDIEYHTDYIPALLEGEQPMGSRSIGYSKECNNFRRKVISHSEKNSRCLDITSFTWHQGVLWKAMQNDQFVFEFRNTLETQMRVHLDEFFCKVYRSLVESVSKIGEEAIETLLSSWHLPDQEMVVQDIKNQLSQAIDLEGKRCLDDLMEYIEDPTKIHQQIISRWKDEFISKFNSKLHEVKMECISNLKEKFEKERSFSKSALLAKLETKDISNLEELCIEMMSKTPPWPPAHLIQHIWQQWSKLSSGIFAGFDTGNQKKKIAIERNAENFLRDILSSDKHLIEKSKDGDNMFSGISLVDFVVERKHIQNDGKKKTYAANRKAIHTLTSKVKHIVEHEIGKVLSDQISFSTTKVRHIIFEAMSCIEHCQEPYTPAFKVDIALAIGSYVVKEFQYKNEEEIKRKTAMIMQTHKDFYIPIIREFVNGNKESVAEACASKVIERCLNGTLKRTIKKIHLTEVCKNIVPLHSKIGIISFLLEKAVRYDDVNAIDLYMRNPKAALILILCKIVNIANVQNEAAKMFLKTTERFQIHLRNQSKIQSQHLGEVLFRTFNLCQLRFTSSDLKTFSSLNVSAGKVLSQVFLKLNNLDSCLWRPTLDRTIERDVDALKYGVADHFISTHFGCFEMCPFCNEVCMFSHEDHDGPHETTMHRPIACKGYYNLETNQYSTETCSSHVASNALVKIKDRYIPFENYNMEFPKWKIQGNISLETSLLWKWYFAQNQDRFQLQGKGIIVPSAWETITKANVVYFLLTRLYNRTSLV